MELVSQTKFGDYVSTLNLIGDHQHLKRERALTKLQNLLKEEDPEMQKEREVIGLAFFR